MPESSHHLIKQRNIKHQTEMNLVKNAFSSLNNIETVLDAPCGTGRATFLLAQMGYVATGIDAGEGAIIKAKELAEKDNIKCTLMEANLKKTPFEDNAFDAVLCFRFFHHLLANHARKHIIEELCRISKTYVLISYLSPVSVTSFKRKARVPLGGRESSQKTTSLKEISVYFKQFEASFTLQLTLFCRVGRFFCPRCFLQHYGGHRKNAHPTIFNLFCRYKKCKLLLGENERCPI